MLLLLLPQVGWLGAWSTPFPTGLPQDWAARFQQSLLTIDTTCPGILLCSASPAHASITLRVMGAPPTFQACTQILNWGASFRGEAKLRKIFCSMKIFRWPLKIWIKTKKYFFSAQIGKKKNPKTNLGCFCFGLFCIKLRSHVVHGRATTLKIHIL